MLDAQSITWKIAGDVRFLPFLGRAFLLQVAHPTIAAGVAEHSDLERDPWGRLARSFGLVLRTVYSADGAQVGEAIRAAHREIGGVTAEGRSYHAYEPEAYFWVVATGSDSIREMAARLGRPLSQHDRERLHRETCELGLRLGLSDADMPKDLRAFDEWFSDMLATRIETSETLERVVTSFARPRAPLWMPDLAWPPLGILTGRMLVAVAVGTLPPAVRDRLRLSWSKRREIELEALCLALRGAGVAPARLRYLPPAQAGFGRHL